MSTAAIHPARRDPAALLKECDVRRLRRSGPGGQHRNKVETAVALHHRPTGVDAEASERRSQAENQQVAMARLRMNLALAVRTPGDSNDVPSELWQSRCRNGRIQVSAEHNDFPAIVAEALDSIFRHDFELKDAALSLGCSGSQLVKLLKAEPRAMALVNDERVSRGKHRLK